MMSTDLSMIRKPELLIPAGGPEALQTAVLYGADAVYLGGPAYGLRAKAHNFGMDELAESIRFAHAHGVKVHVTVNIVAHERHFAGLPEYLRELREIGADALIVSDAGIFMTARREIPDMPLHLSTQASATNAATMDFWYRQGASRIVAARELSLEELIEIRGKLDPGLELETFVHGAMCISISGRCLLSNYMAAKDANLGECVHPCRWKYSLMEETRPGEYYPVTEDEEGTYIFNSKDLCMIEYIPELIRAGIASFKIEGRMKTPLYVAMTAKAYRQAIDDYMTDPELYESRKPYYLQLLSMVSHRGYNTGFYFGHPDQNSQIYDHSDYEKEVLFAAKVLGLSDDGLLVEQRNKFSAGDELFALPPQGPVLALPILQIRDLEGNIQPSANHAKQHLYVETACPPLPSGTILMKRISEE